MVKRKTLNSAFAIIFFIILILYTISLIVPILWTFLVSLKGKLEYVSSQYEMSLFFGLPKKWQFVNYVDVFNALYVTVNGIRGVYLPELFLNGFLYAFVSAVIMVFTNGVVAYVVAKYKCSFTNFIYAMVIVFMILPVVGTLPSELQIMRFLGFYDNMIGVYLMKICFGGTNFLIFYAMFKSISWSYAEAAFVDGASHFKVFFTIMLPMAIPTFFALVLMQFITFWNDWQASLMYFPSFPTVAYALYTFQFPGAGNKTTGVPYIMAACIWVAAPIIVLFLIFKNKIIGSVAVGGLKG